jgi:hypothetical protein
LTLPAFYNAVVMKAAERGSKKDVKPSGLMFRTVPSEHSNNECPNAKSVCSFKIKDGIVPTGWEDQVHLQELQTLH